MASGLLQLLPSLYDALPAGVAAIDLSRRLVYVNDAFCRMMGWSREELLDSSPPYPFYIPEEMGPIIDARRSIYDKGASSAVFEFLFRRRSGETFPVLIQGAALKDGDGRLHGHAGVFTDLSDLKRVEAEALVRERAVREEAEEKGRILDALMEHVPEGITIADAPDVKIRMVSRYGRDILGSPHDGVTAEQVAGRWAVYEKDGVTPVSPGDLPLSRAIARGEVVKDAEVVQVNSQGQPLSLLCNAGPIRDASGKIVGGVVAWRDITGWKRAEESLRQKEAELREAQRIARFGSWFWTAETDASIHSEELLRIYGRDSIPLFKEQKGTMYPPEVWERLNDAAMEAMKAGTGYDLDLPALRGDGSRIWVNAQCEAVRNEKGEIVGLRGTAQDITERKRMEEALKASLADKEMLLRELSHRTKNNMQVIAGLLSLQATGADRALADALSDARDRIQAMALVHERLYQSGNVSSLDMGDYIRNLVVSLLKAHRGGHGPVTPVLYVEEVFLSLDAAQPCGLIINELVSNSLKHAFRDRKGGTIFLSLYRSEEEVVLTYRDDGPGLPPELDLSRIRSLGLKLVHNLAARQLRGTVELRRDPETEFIFRFPYRA